MLKIVLKEYKETFNISFIAANLKLSPPNSNKKEQIDFFSNNFEQLKTHL